MIHPEVCGGCIGPTNARTGPDPCPSPGRYRMGIYQGFWVSGVAYAEGDLVVVCPVSGDIHEALQTHVTSDDDRPETGPMADEFWRVYAMPGQDPNLPGGGS